MDGGRGSRERSEGKEGKGRERGRKKEKVKEKSQDLKIVFISGNSGKGIRNGSNGVCFYFQER